ncbi:MAG: efflux RND transporter periplasmic adaptor subunit [Anaerolineales bacterium]|nr:efflux RND transporter periplasmic adaptor subunit [Anaerolineales bacterium]
MFKQKRNLWLALLLVLALAAGGFWVYQQYFAPVEAQENVAEVQTAVARRGDLVIYASAAGQVVPATELSIGFPSSGTLSELLVHVGDKVTAGQVLARLQTNSSEADIAISVTAAELTLLEAQEALDQLQANWELQAAQALLGLEAAQQNLADLNNPVLQQAQAQLALAQAQEDLNNAQINYNRSQQTASQANIDAAYATMIIAQDNLESAQERFDRVADKPVDDLSRAQAQSSLSAAQQHYAAAVASYNAMLGTSDETEKAIAQANLAVTQAKLVQAQANWESAQDGPTPGEIALAEAQFVAAQAEWERIKDGPDPAEIYAAEVKLANAEAKFESAKEQLANIELLAPSDGTILSISASVGESVGTGAIITLADLSRPLLEIYLDETDLDKVAVGFEVEVVFDAIPEEIFKGQVIEVSPALVSVSGVSAVKALVQLEDFSKPQTLPIGLNAAVDVIGGRAEAAILVPVEALRELGPDEYAVFVMTNGEPKLRIVSVGLIDFTVAEITSGLEAGEVVTTGIVETE